jgi:hypothetical protein
VSHYRSVTWAFIVELTGFEPVTPSLRKMQSDASDQGKRLDLACLWRGCGPSVQWAT